MTARCSSFVFLQWKASLSCTSTTASIQLLRRDHRPVENQVSWVSGYRVLLRVLCMKANLGRNPSNPRTRLFHLLTDLLSSSVALLAKKDISAFPKKKKIRRRCMQPELLRSRSHHDRPGGLFKSKLPDLRSMKAVQTLPPSRH